MNGIARTPTSKFASSSKLISSQVFHSCTTCTGFPEIDFGFVYRENEDNNCSPHWPVCVYLPGSGGDINFSIERPWVYSGIPAKAGGDLFGTIEHVWNSFSLRKSIKAFLLFLTDRKLLNVALYGVRKCKFIIILRLTNLELIGLVRRRVGFT